MSKLDVTNVLKFTVDQADLETQDSDSRIISRESLRLSYLFAYNATKNTHYLRELRRIDKYYVDNFHYLWDMYKVGA